MPTPFSDFHTPLRTLLGDFDPHGQFLYASDDLNSALAVVFLTGDGPENYTADFTARTISPEVLAGLDFAAVLYQAALILVRPEDGASSYRTRAVSATDGGHRKRDLLTAFQLKLSAIQNGGGAVFETQQDVVAWLGAHQTPLRDLLPPPVHHHHHHPGSGTC